MRFDHHWAQLLRMRCVLTGILFVCLSIRSLQAQTGTPTLNSEAPSTTAIKAHPLIVMSSNVRFGTARDGDDSWNLRQDALRDVWREQHADLIGTQEMLQFQADFLLQAFPEYAYVGRSRDRDDDQGEQSGIFYRRERFIELERGHFWLSESPDTPGSKGWDANLPRMVTWVKLYDRSKEAPLIFANTHFDHQGPIARLQSAELLHRKLASWMNTYPVIVTGDFNCGEGSEPYASLMKPFHPTSPSEANRSLVDTYRAKHVDRSEEEGTFNGFRGRRSGPRIDWILVTPDWHIMDANIVRTEFHGRYPSDHFPVTASLTW